MEEVREITEEKKKIKKPVSLIIFEVLCLIAIISIIILANTSVSVGSTNLSKNHGVIEDGWTIIGSDGVEKEFDDWGGVIADSKITLINDLSFANGMVNSIGLYNYYATLKIFYNDELLYEYGKDEDIGDNTKLIGNKYIILPINRVVNSGDKLKFVFETRSFNRVVKMDFGSETNLSNTMFLEFVQCVVSVFARLFLVLFIVFLAISKTTKKYVTRNYWYFCLFFAFSLIWELLDSQFFQILGVSAGIVCFLSSEVYMFMLLPLIVFVYLSCEESKIFRALDMILCALFIVDILVVNVLHFGFAIQIDDTTVGTHLISFVAVLVMVLQTMTSMIISRKRKEAHSYADRQFHTKAFFAFLLFFFVVVAQFILFLVSPANSNALVLRYGVLIFGILIYENIFRSVFGNAEYEVKKRHEKLLSEKQSIEETKSIMIDALKTIIPEKYIPEILKEFKEQEDNVKSSTDCHEPEYLKIGHQMRYATILVSDIRGFSEISSKMNASRLGEMLNHYLATMTEIVEKYNGRVLEFMGDGILAAFGTELENDEMHADNAVKAAIEMQSSIKHVNKWNEKHGFPNQIGIGIGINTGYVFAGIVGSLDRFKYDVLGANVNLASRIEAYTTGGQVLISEDTKYALKGKAEYYGNIVATPKGFNSEMNYFFVKSLDGIKLEIAAEKFNKLRNPIKVKCNLYEEKTAYSKQFLGTVTEVGESSILLETEESLHIFDTIRIEYKEGVTCKVVGMSERGIQLRFTTSARHYDGKTIFADVSKDEINGMTYDANSKKIKREQKKTYSFLD